MHDTQGYPGENFRQYYCRTPPYYCRNTIVYCHLLSSTAVYCSFTAIYWSFTKVLLTYTAVIWGVKMTVRVILQYYCSDTIVSPFRTKFYLHVEETCAIYLNVVWNSTSTQAKIFSGIMGAIALHCSHPSGNNEIHRKVIELRVISGNLVKSVIKKF